MSLEPSSADHLTPLTNAATAAAATALWQQLRAPEWKAFTFETEHVLLHVPSSHILEVDAALAAFVRGDALASQEQVALAKELAELAADLPLPPPKHVKTDIQVVSLNLAQGCNLRCTYCFAGEGDYGVKGMMSHQTAIKALRYFAADRERFHVLFFGGEPMLNFQVIQSVVSWCETQTCRYTFGMTTNGTLLTEDKLRWLNDKRFHLVWSYDGSGLHSRQRLNKDKVSNSEALVERKLDAFNDQLAQMRDFRLRATITKQNLDAFEQAVVSTLTSRHFRLVIAHHATPRQGLMFGQADIDQLAGILTRVVTRLLAAQDYGRLLNLQFIRGNIDLFHRGTTSALACGAGVSYVTVSAQGGFYLCHRFNEEEDERLGDVETGLDRQRLAAVAKFRGAGSAPCVSCWMRQWCAGGCFHENKAASGDTFRLDPMYCKLQDLEMKQAMRVYQALRRDAPQLLPQ